MAVATYHEQGMLEGRWVDVVVMEKILTLRAARAGSGCPTSLWVAVAQVLDVLVRPDVEIDVVGRQATDRGTRQQ